MVELYVVKGLIWVSRTEGSAALQTYRQNEGFTTLSPRTNPSRIPKVALPASALASHIP